MTNMRILALICWMLVSSPVPSISFVHGKSNQLDYDKTNQDLEEILTEESISKFLRPFWLSIPIRNKRNNQVVDEETFPTRHAKHRKRRRCRNRATCIKGFPPQNNATRENRDSAGTVTKAEDPREQLDNIQESFNETKRNQNVYQDELSGSELIDSYDERILSDEIELEDTNVPSWMKTRSKKDEIDESNEFMEETHLSAIYSSIDDQLTFHESLSVLLSKLFQSLRNVSDGQNILKELNFVNATNEDPCQKWLNSRDKIEKVFLGGLSTLPACPCQYPSNIFYDDKIWDEKLKKYFRWRDVSGDSQRLDVYKPGAAYCVRSLLTQGSGSAAAQHCCYDRRRKLLTRGSGAGTPNFVSPEISPILHERIDVLPWRLCKGDFSRYNGVRPPNNDNDCEANPDDEEYQRQIDDTKYY
ncbi:uncharacterized protein LOC143182429 [Calliopsis andreniformis]|uniref:uncharacterized protein LOC143182429 n=1 Tax=Calliopsis andreniformis TaxID=337506 RepID=UPI003FCE08D4